MNARFLTPLLSLSLLAGAPAKPKALQATFASEKAGGESSQFLSAVGNWIVVEDEGKKVLAVDGREWKRGVPSPGLADKARALYGERHEAFLENVKAYAYFPITVCKGVENFTDGEIAVKFKLIGGQMDQCAGILFNLKENGNWLTVRYNLKDVNVVLWTYKEGKRSFVKKGPKETALPLRTWHDLKIAVHGTDLKAWLDGELYLEYTLPEPVSGKVGLWSKTDSIAYFDDFRVTPEK